MQVLIVGSGGREHALALALARDTDVEAVHVAPGNAGAAAVAQLHELDPTQPDAVAELAAKLGVDLVVIGPEAPLVAGAADVVRAHGIPVFGPSADAARIEGSKAFAKDVMAQASVPTAMAHVCVNADQVAAAFDAFGPPYVVKHDGLASGKGVVVTDDRAAALAHAALAYEGRASQVVVEEYLDGPEVSVFCLTDGSAVVPLLPAQDFKRVADGDVGPNTGGMGAYTPLGWAPADLVDTVVERVVQPTLTTLAQRGSPYVGVLYAGLALTSRGVRVVEFNARFGDPETQAILPLLRTPLGSLLHAAATGQLRDHEPPRWRAESAVTVVVSAAGYPEAPRTGDVVDGLAEVAGLESVELTHAGTAHAPDGSVVVSGGRVLAVTGRGTDLVLARDRAYDAVARIQIAGAHHRHDIALKAAYGEISVPART